MKQHRSKFYNIILFAMVIIMVSYDAIYSIIPRIVMLVLQGLAFLWFASSVPKYFLSSRRNKFLSTMIVLIVVVTIYFSLTGGDKVSDFTFYKQFLLCTLCIFPFFVYSVSEKQLSRLFIILAIISIYSFLYILGVNRSENENAYGGGYFVLAVMPLGLFVLRRKSMLIQSAWMIIVFALVLYSLKRGDILACSLSIIVFFLAKYLQGKNVRAGSIFLLIVTIAVGAILINQMMETSELFQQRLDATREGDTSEREYALYFAYYMDAPLYNKVFGFGFNGTENLSFWGHRAHNDWLEFLIGEGLFGAIPYLILFVTLLRYSLRKMTSSETRPILLVIMVIWLVKSFFSMFFFSTPTIMIFILIGYIFRYNAVEDSK